MRSRSDSLTAAERAILDDVEVHGVHVVHVAGDDENPPFSYSVGLWESFGQPEVVVFGLPDGVAGELIQAIADEADEGKRFDAGTKHDGLLQGYPVRFMAVPKSHYADHLGVALWAYEGDAFSAVQLVWPDKQGRWPWDEGARQGYRELQPVLERRSAEDGG